MKKKKIILDACCGSRMFWFDKTNPFTVFVDRRKESHVLSDGRVLNIKPDIVADFRKLSFKAKTFKLVVFDPPHLKGAGSKGWQAKKYGNLDANWPQDLRAGFAECMRVLDDYGTLIFKWNEQSIKVNAVIEAIGQEPLFGHRTLQASKTIWMAFIKEPK